MNEDLNNTNKLPNELLSDLSKKLKERSLTFSLSKKEPFQKVSYSSVQLNQTLSKYFSSEEEKQKFLKNPEKREALFKLNQLLEHKLQSLNNLEDLYHIIQEINNLINIIYPNIECKSGCSRCCKFSGSPQIYKVEWEKLKNYIEKNFSEKEIKRIKRKFIDSINILKDLIENEDNSNIENLSNIELFFISECPFLYKNMCSVYEARPLICRTFGLSMMENPNNKPDYEMVMACLEERNRWQEEYKDHPEKKIFLPNRLNLSTPLFKFSTDDEKVVRPIQYWLTEYFDEY